MTSSEELEKSVETILQSIDPKSQEAITEEVSAWLGRLVLLYGVPFHYLIPEEAMLPKESIRFFFLDPNWVQSLLQGACSVGNAGYIDSIIDKAMNEWLQPNEAEGQAKSSQANKKAAGVRDRLRAQYEGVALPPQSEELDWPLTGVLLRSAVVEGWRGLEVMAYKDLSVEQQKHLGEKLAGEYAEYKTLFEQAGDKQQRAELKKQLRAKLRNSTSEQKQQLYKTAEVYHEEQFIKLLTEWVAPLKALRIEQLSHDVMLGIFNGMVGQLVIRQPQEGLHFGLTPANGDYTKTLRQLGYKNSATAGEIVDGKKINLSEDGLMRDATKGVINIKNLAQKLKNQLSSSDELKDNTFTSAEFAVEMIESAGEFTFIPERKAQS